MLPSPPTRVLQWFDAATPHAPWVGLGGSGGYSGAKFWRKKLGTDDWCLRCWPLEHPSPQRLNAIHQWLHECCRLPYIPVPWKNADGVTWLETAEGRWELTPWLPGVADYSNAPSPPRLESATIALAKVHRVWSRHGRCAKGPSPAVKQRIQLFESLRAGEYQKLNACFVREPRDGLSGLARRVLAQYDRFHTCFESLLKDFGSNPGVIQPCIRDVWHDHLLFQEERLVGIIDFGAMREDVVAGDLGRMLGSLVGDDPALWNMAREAYDDQNFLVDSIWRLARLLDLSGCLLGAVNWLRWLWLEKRYFENGSRVEARLTQLLARMEHWPPPDSLTAGLAAS